MSVLVARTGRINQRYENGYRLVAGCIPFKYKESDRSLNGVEVLLISSASGGGLLFPKGGWENDETVEEAAEREALEEAGVRGKLLEFMGEYQFKSKTLRDDYSPDGLCKAYVFPLLVKEQLESWPEQATRKRRWLSLTDAIQNCRYPWMQHALHEGFTQWHARYLNSTP